MNDVMSRRSSLVVFFYVVPDIPELTKAVAFSKVSYSSFIRNFVGVQE